MAAYVASADDAPEVHEPDGTARTRVVIDASHGCALLEQRVVAFTPGRSLPRHDDARDELLYVVSGRGRLELDGEAHALEPDAAAYLAAGETGVIVNDGPDDLVTVSVTVPTSLGGDAERRRVVVRYDEQPVLRAGADREFRYLVNQDAGCLDATQFVGVIPPSKAPLHSHGYDEVVYVLEGEGQIHAGDEIRPLRPGTCVHLPPQLVHCLENSGTANMRVLGVFHPSGDPASRSYDEAAAGATG
jgi:mannose-6-phosphate isomerase-like protein (cupin superfamily)